MSDPVLTTSIEPSSPVTAGSIGSWTLRFQATGAGLPGHSTIRVSTDTDTDWGVPQFDDPTAAEFRILFALAISNEPGLRSDSTIRNGRPFQ